MWLPTTVHRPKTVRQFVIMVTCTGNCGIRQEWAATLVQDEDAQTHLKHGDFESCLQFVKGSSGQTAAAAPDEAQGWRAGRWVVLTRPSQQNLQSKGVQSAPAMCSCL